MMQKAHSSRRTLRMWYQRETFVVVLNVSAEHFTVVSNRIDWPVPVLLSGVLMRIWKLFQFFEQGHGAGTDHGAESVKDFALPDTKQPVLELFHTWQGHRQER